jgi:hypothetical protein
VDKPYRIFLLLLRQIFWGQGCVIGGDSINHRSIYKDLFRRRKRNIAL